MTIVTREAEEAVDCMVERLPETTYQMFVREPEASIKPVLAQFGFDAMLKDGFGVKSLVAHRDDYAIKYVSIRVIQFVGDRKYAQLPTGVVLEFEDGFWKRSELTIKDVKRASPRFMSQPLFA